MNPRKPTLNDKLIQELTEWTLQQIVEAIQQGKLDVRKIVCRLLREGQRTKQAQMPRDTKGRPARKPKGKKQRRRCRRAATRAASWESARSLTMAFSSAG